MKIESKEKLAKLLAIEDLDVQHQQVQTAMFDLKSRTLVLPTWKEMPNHLYDLLVGHEVGHALFTPTSEERLKKAYKKTSKACINILEDARIEKLIKKRYPGLRKQFFSGYQHLIEKDFFGLSERPISTMNILDKINLYFKIPNAVDIEFNDIEQSFINKIEAAKSFKDIEAIASEIYKYAKAEKKEEEEKEEEAGNKDEKPQPEFSDEKIDGNFEESDELEADEIEAGEGEEEDGDTDNIDNDDEIQKAEGDDSTHSDVEPSGFDRYMDDDKTEKEVLEQKDIPQDEVRSTTYERFQKRLNELVDKDITNTYLTIPDKVDLSTAVEDYKDVHYKIDKFYNSRSDNLDYWRAGNWDDSRFSAMQKYVYAEANKTLSQFKKESVKTVNHIAMEFERKKAADVYKKVMVTKTGVLDTNKLFSAKYNDDVFKKNVRLPEGKNHGLVMIIDWSGSMSDNIYGCIRQVMELSFFCKKVNIPFEVYSFTEPDHRYEDNGKWYYTRSAFKYKHGDLVVDSGVRLRNYLSSRMNARDYNKGLLNMCILANRYKRTHTYSQFSYYPCPKDDDLKCTPLNGAILLSEHVIRKFKKDNNLQNVNAVFLTDGEASGSASKYDITKDSEHARMQGQMFGRDCKRDKANAYVKDNKTKKNYLISRGGYAVRNKGMTPALLDVVKDRLGINIVGFFILNSFSNNNLWRYVPQQKHVTYQAGQDFYAKWIKQVKKNGYFIMEESGYDEYYVIKGDGLKDPLPIEDLNVKPDMTAHRMAQNFMKKNNAFKANRVILSRFIDLITEDTMV